ncbi:MAG TPA: c-type cytochrome biogenesis protein CcmI [Rhizobiaceae bacterium]|nr:c-type cytochrome biogenesis protein CcmI [Rhizobiaceae bacterium]
MFFWFAAALLTLAASMAVLMPLTRREPRQSGAGDHDLEVYKDQLAELDRDAARGLIQPSEAGEARAEIGRRILKVAGAQASGDVTARPAARLVGVVAVLAVPLVSWSLYSYLGSPDLPSQPLQARMEADPAKSPVEELVARAEAHLVANPDDGKGWDVLAPIYLRVGRFQDAVTAYGNAIRLEGATANREAGLGEAIAATGGGTMNVEARGAFERALKLEPGNPKARFFLAAGLAQDGRMEEASAGWRAMIADLPTGSPWRAAAEQALAETTKRLSGSGEPAGTPGPSQDDMEAAAGMSDADRATMIETMVANLDEKLRQNPKDPEGWRRLVRSYMVLDRRAEAAAALERGVTALGAGSTDAAALLEFAAGLGLARTE